MTILKIILLIFSCIFGLFCQNFWIGKRHGTRHVTFERFDNTCGDRNIIIIFNHGDMTSVNGKVILNSTITVKRDVNMELKTLISISRCKSKETLDTCEHFHDHKVDDYCEMIESKHTLWGSLFGSYVPEYKCPIKKGIYRSVNSTLDVSALLLFPVNTWYWRVKVEVKDTATERMVTCMIVETRIASTSSK